MVMSASLNGSATDDVSDENEGDERRLLMFSRTRSRNPCSGTTLQPAFRFPLPFEFARQVAALRLDRAGPAGWTVASL
eukprot:3613290-Pleurochrysis_carterae.AAC.1